MRSRAGSITLLALAVAGTAAGAFAGAGDGGLPRATLQVGPDSHRLEPWTATFSSLQDDGTCVTGVSDGIPDWKPAARVDRRVARARVVFRTSTEPDRVKVVYGVRLRHGSARGLHRPPVEISPTTHADGRIAAWVAKFPVRVKDKAFVDVSAAWPPTDGCQLGDGANWEFKLKRAAHRG